MSGACFSWTKSTVSEIDRKATYIHDTILQQKFFSLISTQFITDAWCAIIQIELNNILSSRYQ